MFDGIRQPDLELVSNKGLSVNLKDLVELLQRELLGLGNEKEDADEREGVEAGIETEGSDLAHSRDHGREGETEHTG